ncbi:MAG: regulatory protein RecX [Acinetobacter sp.]
MSQYTPQEDAEKTMTGARLRGYAFALLAKREHSKAELREKLRRYAMNLEEVDALLQEFEIKNYQSDERYAELVLSSQINRGKGPRRILQTLHLKEVQSKNIQEQIKDIDWNEQAYNLKVKKFGTEVSKDPKVLSKQIRFLQYRGYDMDVIMKVIRRKIEE